MEREIEEIACGMIASIGMARSKYIEAVQKAKQYDFDAAGQLMKEGGELYLQGHEIHYEILQKEVAGNKTEFSLLLMHAEDIMLSTECFKVMAEEFICLYQTLKENQISRMRS